MCKRSTARKLARTVYLQLTRLAARRILFAEGVDATAGAAAGGIIFKVIRKKVA